MKRGRAPRWLMLLCTLAAGCDYLFNIDHIASSDATAAPPVDIAGDAPGPSCGTPILSDKFDGPTICAPWGEVYMDLEARMVEEGQLVITPGPVVNSVGGCVAVAQHAFGTGVAARVTEVLRGSDAYTVLHVHGPNVMIKATGDGLLHFQTSSSVDLGPPVPYRPDMFWWRIRPDGTTAVVGEYSSDGADWMPLGILLMAPPSMITPEITVGTNTAMVSGNGTFDQLLICSD